MYALRPNLVLAFHGCDQKLRDRLVLLKEKPLASTNGFDWLGWGPYFCENDPARALAWAHELKRNAQHDGQKIATPSVVGAVIALGNCLDLLDSKALEVVQNAHKELLARSRLAEIPLPKNIGGRDRGARYLDCAVINFLHQRIAEGAKPFYNL